MLFFSLHIPYPKTRVDRLRILSGRGNMLNNVILPTDFVNENAIVRMIVVILNRMIAYCSEIGNGFSTAA